ncbi:hypothetical protein RS9917_11026 [Synechococcus sp. RS9917]|nr:hypothetical protein RS9917_11026 [Synechococcus sp. RS9917]
MPGHEGAIFVVEAQPTRNHTDPIRHCGEGFHPSPTAMATDVMHRPAAPS